jgi:hypothetical protein
MTEMVTYGSKKRGPIRWLPPTLWVAGILMVLLTFAAQTGYRPFAPFDWAQYTRLLLMLTLVALFIERATEVAVKVWRQPERLRLEKKAKAENAGRTDGEVLTEYRGATQRFSLSFGFAIGVLVALAGVRSIRPLLDPAFINVQRLGQPWFLDMADVTVTGLVIGGGAAGMHSIVKAFLGVADQIGNKNG